MPKVVVFSTTSYSWCRRGKALRENGVPVKEVNVERDHDAAHEIRRKTGQSGVPVSV